jgi:hypothetical protein
MDLNWPSPFGATVASAARDVMAHMTAARQLRQDSVIARIMIRSNCSGLPAALAALEFSRGFNHGTHV